MSEFWRDILCAECGEPFTDEIEWDCRHSRHDDGADVHEHCCPDCSCPP